MGTASFDYGGQVVLVTGGTRGVGRVIAHRFEQAGATVIVCARSMGDDPVPTSWSFLAADLRDGDQASATIDAVVATHGRLDVVINNAGGAPPVDTSTAPHRLTERIVALNLLAPMFVSQHANRVMQAQAHGGVIVNIGSVAGRRAAPTAAAYAAAKAGLENFTMTAAQEWAPKVRVNSLVIGLIGTDQALDHYGDEASVARIERTIPAGRLARPDDVANACLFLASSSAGYVTGAALVMHGGGDRPAYIGALEQT